MGEQPPLYRICPEAEHSAPGYFCIRKREVLKMSITQKALAEQDYIVSLRRDFHAHPEISLKEYRTAQRIEEELDKLGIPHQRSGETGVYAEIKGERPGTGIIALRADIDALAITETHEVPYKSQTPGVMHACGHDSHAAALLGAAKLLAAEKANFGGTVRLFFQPAEEIGKGAKEFIRDGHLDGVQRVFGLHAASDLPVGTIGVTAGSNNAAVDGFKIIVHGVNAHVSTPQLGGDNFAEYQQKVPGVYAYLGTRDPENPNTALAHHNDGFDLGEKALPYGTALYAQVALWWLQEGAEQA